MTTAQRALSPCPHQKPYRHSHQAGLQCHRAWRQSSWGLVGHARGASRNGLQALDLTTISRSLRVSACQIFLAKDTRLTESGAKAGWHYITACRTM